MKKIQTLVKTVKRSAVGPVRSHREYLQILRKDFYYSCAYCTLTEFEAQGYSFEVDHYEPQSARPELVNVYENLMYSCECCNRNKSDLDPPAKLEPRGSAS